MSPAPGQGPVTGCPRIWHWLIALLTIIALPVIVPVVAGFFY